MLTIKLPRDDKALLIERVLEYFHNERSEEIGNIAAESILDFMLKELGPVIYNQAIFDARNLVSERLASLEEDLYVLEQPNSVRGHRGV